MIYDTPLLVEQFGLKFEAMHGLDFIRVEYLLGV